MADELKKNLAADVTLVRGSGGVFEVKVDGRLVFSKKKIGRHAEPGEIMRILRES